jgi:hypothetical protein
LLKEYNKLWVFGDSYVTPDVCVPAQESFWGLTAAKFDIPVIMNYSRPGNSVDSVCHLLISEQDQYNWDNDLFLIGLPPLERITVFDDFKDTPYYGRRIETSTWNRTEVQLQSHHGLVANRSFSDDMQLIIHSDRSWLETQILRTIFLLTSWLDANNANYVIVNCSEPLDSNNIRGPSNFVLPYAKKHTKCILFKDTYYDINYNVNKPADFDQYGWHGHHGPAGNKHFFENSLLPTMQRNNFC